MTGDQLRRAREIADALGYDLDTAIEVVAIADGDPGCLRSE